MITNGADGMLDHKRLREGYTTGACAAAAAKGAAEGLINGRIPVYVEITTPIGRTVKLRLQGRTVGANFAECCVRKDAGDDPDVTNGALIFCRLEAISGGRPDSATARFGHLKNTDGEPAATIVITGGRGVGVVTKPGLQIKVGEAAINPVPRQMIKDAVLDIVGNRGLSLKATISVPDGESIAKRTFNQRLGILNGISIIGTTGFVRPMSEAAITSSLRCELDIAKAMGFTTVVLVPGNLAETAVRKRFPLKSEQVAQMSNFAGFMLTAADANGFNEIILAGHPGKLAKLIRGDFNTHSSVAKPANDIILNLAADDGIDSETLDSIRQSPTVDGIIGLVQGSNKPHLFDKVAERIESAASDFLGGRRSMGAVLFNMEKSVIGMSQNARRWEKRLTAQVL